MWTGSINGHFLQRSLHTHVCSIVWMRFTGPIDIQCKIFYGLKFICEIHSPICCYWWCFGMVGGKGGAKDVVSKSSGRGKRQRLASVGRYKPSKPRLGVAKEECDDVTVTLCELEERVNAKSCYQYASTTLPYPSMVGEFAHPFAAYRRSAGIWCCDAHSSKSDVTHARNGPRWEKCPCKLAKEIPEAPTSRVPPIHVFNTYWRVCKNPFWWPWRQRAGVQ